MQQPLGEELLRFGPWHPESSDRTGELAQGHGAAAADTMTVQMTVKKLSGYNVPNYQGNGQLGYGPNAISGKGY